MKWFSGTVARTYQTRCWMKCLPRPPLLTPTLHLRAAKPASADSREAAACARKGRCRARAGADPLNGNHKGLFIGIIPSLPAYCTSKTKRRSDPLRRSWDPKALTSLPARCAGGIGTSGVRGATPKGQTVPSICEPCGDGSKICTPREHPTPN